MRPTLLSIVTVLAAALPAWADGYYHRGHYADRGLRYVDGDRPSWGFSFGYSSGGYFGESVSIGFSYSDGPRYRPRPVVYVPPAYCPPPVVVVTPPPPPPPPPPVVYYPASVYCPPPVVVYPAPRPWPRGGYVYTRYEWGICR